MSVSNENYADRVDKIVDILSDTVPGALTTLLVLTVPPRQQLQQRPGSTSDRDICQVVMQTKWPFSRKAERD